MNYEFARPVTSSQQHTNQLDPELFPHAYNVIKDAQTGRRDGILKRPRTDPLVFHTQTSTEYWQKRGCLAHTDGKGNDLRIPNNVRIYVIASAQHNSPFGSEPVKDGTQQRINPLPAGDVLRALMVAMDLWVTKGISPPPSRYPTARDRTLVSPKRNNFPKIPDVRFAALHNRQLFLDYGPHIRRGKMKIHPPQSVNKGEYQYSCRRLMRTGTTSPAFACRLSACRSGRLPGGISGRAASPKANWRACLAPLSLSQKQRRNGDAPAIHGDPSKNATRTATTTFGNSAAPRGGSSSNAIYWRKMPRE